MINYSEAIERTYDLCDVYYDMYWCPGTNRSRDGKRKCPFATIKGECRLEQSLFKTYLRLKYESRK